MPSAIELAQGDPALLAAIRRSRRLLGRKALMAAAASAVPLPGIDFAADAALLGRLVPQISAEFGLAAPQIAHLSPKQRERVVQVAGSLGAVLVGKLVTRDLLMTLARHAGMKLGAKQAARFVPLAGQVVSAALGYAALRAMGEQHIKDCVRVARAAQLVLPGPAPSPATLAGTAADTAALPSSAPRPFWRRLGAR